MVFFEEILHNPKVPRKNLRLVADIGGTNTGFAVLEKKNKKLGLVVSFHFQSNKIKSFHRTVKEVLDYCQEHYKIKLSKACFAAAGPVSKNNDYCKLTNLSWSVSKKKILGTTKLKEVSIINDFDAIGYGINVLDKKNIIQVKSGTILKGARKAVIGAGTGLGKSLLLWNKDHYKPLSSEGGHADLVVQNKEEFALLNFIFKHKKGKNVEWEDVLSGKGIKHMYLFLNKKRRYPQTTYQKEIKKENFDPRLITKYHHCDPLCKDTMTLFTHYYGKCAKNFALDCLALGGIYIAGGIAAKIPHLFKRKTFREAFISSSKQSKLLKKIPVYVIDNYKISLYGAGMVAFMR